MGKSFGNNGKCKRSRCPESGGENEVWKTDIVTGAPHIAVDVWRAGASFIAATYDVVAATYPS